MSTKRRVYVASSGRRVPEVVDLEPQRSEEHGDALSAAADFGACDCCGGPKPKTGWRLLELSVPTRRKRLGIDTWTWQLCAVCSRRKLKLGGRLLVPAAASRVGVKA